VKGKARRPESARKGPATPGAQRKRRRTYEAHKDQAGARQADLSRAGRDIGQIPAVADPERRAEASGSLRRCLEIYFPETFYLPWSADHLKVIARIEEAVLRGGQFALAMPRRTGKTAILIRAAIWAILTGRCRFVGLIGPDKGHAKRLLSGIRSELESNDLLLADFPEVCYPVRCIGGIVNRCAGQHCRGKRTQIELTKEYVLLARLPKAVMEAAGVPEANGTGGIFYVAGLTGQVRGMFLVAPTGETLRPDFILLDDPQTRKSAGSDTMTDERERIIFGDVLYLGGGKKPLSAFMACTVIYAGDLADRFLDRGKRPEWQGERTKMVVRFPENERLWDEYALMRKASFDEGGHGEAATEFYGAHREAMDKGVEVSWPDRFERGELSAVQYAMNLRLKDEQSFYAECQNEPLALETDALAALEPEAICGKASNRPRGEVPKGAEVLTAFVDVQERLLYYAVCAWRPEFTGHVVDYGTWPDQGRAHFTSAKAGRTLRMAHPGTGLEGSVYAGLDALTEELAGREWKREDGAILRLDLVLIDANWGAVTDTVHQLCRESGHAAALMPSRGQGIGAANKPISEYDRHKGDRIGHHWWVPSMKGKRLLRHLEVDVNYWKSFVHERLGTAPGDPGCLSLFGEKKKAYQHRMFAEHLTAEYRVRTTGRGRTVDEWRLKPGKPDNHWFDCLVGCAAGASFRGVELRKAAQTARPRKPSFSELQRLRQAERERRR
jgi:hypothetical protein